MAEPLDNSIRELLTNSSPLTGQGIILDVGTGDGLFVYQSAQKNPRKFYIGIDASPKPLEKISEKIHRKPAKGGLSNVLFIQAAVEDLPSELTGVADEVHVHFPWGSLLRAVATGDASVLRNLRRTCLSGAMLEILIGIDPERDRSEWKRLELLPLTLSYIDSVLRASYKCSGFEIQERGILSLAEWAKLETSWAKRLKGNAQRSVIYIVAQAVEAR